MSNFEVKVRRVDAVEPHPDADRLDIVTILGYRAITNKREDGSSRYKVGDLVVYVPEASMVPESLLRQYGYWNEEKGRGLLAGKSFDRVKIVRLRGVYSQGLVWPTTEFVGEGPIVSRPTTEEEMAANGGRNTTGMYVQEGTDVAEFFGLTKYVPPIPDELMEACVGEAEFAYGYDFDSVQRWKDLFQPGEPVVVTEKLNGTLMRVSYRRQASSPNLFGPDRNVAVTAKGLGAKGLVFADNPKNRETNLYVRTAVQAGLVDKVLAMAAALNADSLDVFGEIVGPGAARKFQYGLAKAQFYAFDLRVGQKFADEPTKEFNFSQHGIAEVPVLYSGPFDMAVVERLRDEPSALPGSKNIREGVVVVAAGEQKHREHRGERLRPILKVVSPAYLLKEDDDALQ